MKKSELRQIIKEEIENIKSKSTNAIFKFEDYGGVNITPTPRDSYGYDYYGSVGDGDIEFEIELDIIIEDYYSDPDVAFEKLAPPIFKEIIERVGGIKVAKEDMIRIIVDFEKFKKVYDR